MKLPTKCQFYNPIFISTIILYQFIVPILNLRISFSSNIICNNLKIEKIMAKKKKMDNRGIDPLTYRMRSDRSTIWANYPHLKTSKMGTWESDIQKTLLKWTVSDWWKKSMEMSD